MKTFRIRSRVVLAAALLCGLDSVAIAQQSAPPPPPAGADALPRTRAPLGGVGVNSQNVQNSFAPNRDTVGSMKAYTDVLRVARCLAGRSKSQVLKALEAMPSSAIESRRYSRAYETVESCGPQHTTILSLQRGSWSEAMYLKVHPKRPDANVDSVATERFVSGEQRWNADREPGDQAMISATNCLVANQPATADMILRTEHGTREEEALLDRIFAEAPQCAGAARPDGLSKTFLRAFIADSLYRAAEGENKIPQFAA